MADVLELFTPDLIVMSGWMRIMSAAFVEHFARRIINQHPALLPDEASDTYRLADGRSIPAIRGAHAVRDLKVRPLSLRHLHNVYLSALCRCGLLMLVLPPLLVVVEFLRRC